MRQPLVNIPKAKKPRKPIRKISTKMINKKAAMALALKEHFKKYGWEYFGDETGRKALCQLCNFDLDLHGADFHHKRRASQGGSNGPENGLVLHRLCHSWLHANRDVEDAARNSPADLQNGLSVQLTDQQRFDLSRYLGLNYL